MKAGFDAGPVARLLPMHMVLAGDGMMLRCGPTLRKLVGGAARLDEVATLQRPHPLAPGGVAMIRALDGAARSGERIFLRIRQPFPLVLRGHAVPMAEGRLLVNLGFGIGLVEAVRAFNLTDADFAPDDLAMELLFMHEANRAVIAELSGFSTQLDAARQRAETEAFTDPLTGLANRRAFDLAMGLAKAATGEAADFALAHLDLDYFKAVNDSLGHAAGDAVLCHVADVMRAVTRAQDTVARIGGDEFVLILPGVIRRSALDALLTRLIARIEQPIITPSGTARVSVSIGVTLSPAYRGQPAALIHRDADRALYAAKQAGRGCWRLFEPAHG